MRSTERGTERERQKERQLFTHIYWLPPKTPQGPQRLGLNWEINPRCLCDWQEPDYVSHSYFSPASPRTALAEYWPTDVACRDLDRQAKHPPPGQCYFKEPKIFWSLLGKNVWLIVVFECTHLKQMSSGKIYFTAKVLRKTANEEFKIYDKEPST